MEKWKYVNTIIGTVGEVNDKKSHGGGKTHPGACTPGGMVQLSPDTVTGGDNGTGYNYCMDTIEGFSFNHMSGIGWYGDMGNIQVMPITGETDLRSGSNREVPFTKGTKGWKSEFSHNSEKTEAGYYSVFLERYSVLTECTAAPHTGIMKITYPDNENAGLILNFSRRIGGKADFQEIRILNNRKIEGTVFCTPKGGGFGRGDGKISYNLSFVLELSEDAKEMRFFENEELKEEGLTEFNGEDVGLRLYFGKCKAPVYLKCAIAYTDIDGARKNFTETEGFDFDVLRKNARDLWQNVFDCVDVEGTNETDLTIFYTCLYHVLLDPRSSTDVDGRFSVDCKTYTDNTYTHRTMFSGWDVYRSEFPLLSLIRPDMVNDTVNSLLRIALLKNSSFPKWELLGIDSACMVGDPGLIVVADAFTKGIRNYDVNKAYEIAKASVLCSDELFGKPFKTVHPKNEQYKNEAFHPERLSDTLEFLLASFALSRFAALLGKTDDADFFRKRAERYRDNYNKRLGFMAPRKKNGRFMLIKGRYDDEGCVESNIFQQSWFVPYDVKGLSRLFGEARTLRLLEKLFSKAKLGALWSEDYNHSNEPCHNITHYFSILGLPRRTEYWTRRVQKEAYRLGAFGFCGNEDVGQLSAWYVLSAIGFAQVCPAKPEYYLNTPLFRKASVKLNKEYHSCSVSDTFTVLCDKDPLSFPYIKKAELNGKEIVRGFLTYEEITAGGSLHLTLSDNSDD